LLQAVIQFLFDLSVFTDSLVFLLIRSPLPSVPDIEELQKPCFSLLCPTFPYLLVSLSFKGAQLLYRDAVFPTSIDRPARLLLDPLILFSLSGSPSFGRRFPQDAGACSRASHCPVPLPPRPTCWFPLLDERPHRHG